MKSIDSNITGHLPSISLRYINDENRLTNFFNRNNNLKNYYDQIKEKKNNYNNDYRKLLFDVLNNNYEKVSKNTIQLKSIKLLKDHNTFSVTTGHQINLFTGPLYFFYKIIDTIKICNELKSKYIEPTLPDKKAKVDNDASLTSRSNVLTGVTTFNIL